MSLIKVYLHYWQLIAVNILLLAIMRAQASVQMTAYKGYPGKTIAIPNGVTHTIVSKGENSSKN